MVCCLFGNGGHISWPPYRMVPPSIFKEFVQHLRQLLAMKVIRKNSSQYASPVVLVRKMTWGLKMCVDYRFLNRYVIRDAYPLPRIEESMSALKVTRVFSTMDLKSAYYQVEVAEEIEEKTAFCTLVVLWALKRSWHLPEANVAGFPGRTFLWSPGLSGWLTSLLPVAGGTHEPVGGCLW